MKKKKKKEGDASIREGRKLQTSLSQEDELKRIERMSKCQLLLKGPPRLESIDYIL